MPPSVTVRSIAVAGATIFSRPPFTTVIPLDVVLNTTFELMTSLMRAFLLGEYKISLLHDNLVYLCRYTKIKVFIYYIYLF